MNIKYLLLLSMSILFLNIFMLHSSQAASWSVQTQNPPMFSVLSWNILGPNTQDVEKVGNFKQGDYSRLNQVVTEINKLKNPYVICLQEVDKTSESILTHALNNYKKVAYQSKGKNGGVILFVRGDKFEVLGNKSLPLLGDGTDVGAAVIGCLRSKKTGAVVIISSLHLSRTNGIEGQSSGDKQLGQLLQEVKNLETNLSTIIGLGNKIYKIFAGDFNTLSASLSTVINLIEKNDNNQKYMTLFPTHLPTVQKPSNQYGHQFDTIDYVLHQQDLKVPVDLSKIVGYKDQQIVTGVPSDHAILYGVFFDPIGSSFIPAHVQKAPSAKNTTFVNPFNSHQISHGHSTSHAAHPVHVSTNQQEKMKQQFEKNQEEEKAKQEESLKHIKPAEEATSFVGVVKTKIEEIAASISSFFSKDTNTSDVLVSPASNLKQEHSAKASQPALFIPTSLGASQEVVRALDLSKEIVQKRNV